MVDFIIVVALTTACTLMVRRVRKLGFAGLRLDLGIDLSLARSVLSPSARIPAADTDIEHPYSGTQQPSEEVAVLPAAGPETPPVAPVAPAAASRRRSRGSLPRLAVRR